MPAITRQGDTCTGHDDCPPSSLVGCESNVLIDSKPVGRVSDAVSIGGSVASGSPTVTVDSLALMI